jgi:DNA (cytosine-5)-methyltransferase 1
MERIAYDFGASDLCAASVKSPNIRQRLFWVADANGGCQGNGELQRSGEYGQQPEDGGVGGVGNTTHKRRNAVGNDDDASERSTIALGVASSDGCRLGDTVEQGLEGHAGNESDGAKSGRIETIQARPTAQASRPWDSFEWFPCTDGKSRRTKPGLQLLAHGVSGRVVRLRGYGNAINPYVAKEFIEAYIEAKNQIEEPELSL